MTCGVQIKVGCGDYIAQAKKVLQQQRLQARLSRAHIALDERCAGKTGPACE
jgi:hypothetical protein